MTRSLENQVAIVTGASSGIGAGIASSLAQKGAAIIINYRSDDAGAQATLDNIVAAGGRGAIRQADVSDETEIDGLVRYAVKKFGRLDIMVANAGLQSDAPALDMTPAQWDTAMSVDLRGHFLCAQAAARQFLRQGNDNAYSAAAGKILTVLSVHDVIPWAGHVNYAAAKAGAKMMMQTLAQEWAKHRIRVVGISPGAIKTDINKSVWSDPAGYTNLLKLIPYGRIGLPEDVGRLAAWLVSDDADYITGTTIYIDGGMTLYPGFMDNG